MQWGQRWIYGVWKRFWNRRFFLVVILLNLADGMEFFYKASLVWSSDSQK